MIELANEQLVLHILEKGAEMCSLVKRTTNQEYLWKGDPQYWKRHAPVLFPIVGSVWNGEYRIGEKIYHLPQHGFARDNDFGIIETTKEKAVFQLKSSEKTLEVYPYHFVLRITYELKDSTIKVTWNVENPSDETIYFQIGAHPAFNYPEFNEYDAVRGYLKADTDHLVYKLLGEKGCLHSEASYTLHSEDGLFSIRHYIFDNDALIIENNQTKSISLLDKEKRPYLTVQFDAPVVGLWSPVGKNAPFMCIEPWYGRCDAENYNGDFREKEWMNSLEPHQTFEQSYTIIIE